VTGLRLTWWGHATVGIELAGLTVLTDPVLTSRVAFLHRHAATPPPAAAEADVVLLSHLHGDHLHRPSLRRLPEHARIIAPRGAGRLLSGLAARVEEVLPGEQVQLGELSLTAVHAEHDDRRHPWSPHSGPALGFVLADGVQRLWFAGDTGLFDGMAALGPVDAALIPVGGWGPTLGPHHLDPAQAAAAAHRVRARHAVPIHFGTLWPTGLRPLAPGLFRAKCRAPGREFVSALAGTGVTVHLLNPGESTEITAAEPGP